MIQMASHVNSLCKRYQIGVGLNGPVFLLGRVAPIAGESVLNPKLHPGRRRIGHQPF
jgi:hypothetical protein